MSGEYYPCLSPIIPEVESSGMKAGSAEWFAGGAAIERSGNGGNWRSQARSSGGSLRICQRRQPEQQRPQSDAAIKWGAGAALLGGVALDVLDGNVVLRLQPPKAYLPPPNRSALEFKALKYA